MCRTKMLHICELLPPITKKRQVNKSSGLSRSQAIYILLDALFILFALLHSPFPNLSTLLILLLSFTCTYFSTVVIVYTAALSEGGQSEIRFILM